MAKALIAKDAIANQTGKTELLSDKQSDFNKIGYSYIGLRYLTKDNQVKTKSPDALTNEFTKSLSECCHGLKNKDG
jgi:hypothetical protein